MTEADAGTEALADRIASRGREALVERLRKAYTAAAATHADVVSLNGDRIEAMVQAAVDRADGLQWRRALADVAAEEMGVSLPEALSHPAVVRAQEIVGAPSYEASLAEIVARPVPPVDAAPVDAAPPVEEESVGAEPIVETETFTDEPDLEDGPEASESVIEEDPLPPPAQPERVIEDPELHGATDELEIVEADDEMVELLPPPEPVEYERDFTEPQADATTEAPAPPTLEPEPFEPESEADETEADENEADENEADDGEAENEAEADDSPTAPEDQVEQPTQAYELEPEPEDNELEPETEDNELEPETEDDETADDEPEEPDAGSNTPDIIAGGGSAVDEFDPVPSQFTDRAATQFAGPLPGEGWGVVDDEGSSEAEAQPEAGSDSEPESDSEAQPEPASDASGFGQVPELRLTAYHLGGVANLPAGRDGLGLRLSESGLDILQPTGEIIGRLHWNEIDALEVNSVRGRLRRNARSQSRIVVRTKQGDASFRVPGFSSEELQLRVDPLLSSYCVSD